MKSFQVVRTHFSPYHHPNFKDMEKTLLEGVQNIDYKTLESWQPNKDTVLITNTHTYLSSLPEDLLNQTKLIIHANSGYDNFAKDENLWPKIPIVIGHSIRAQAVAEYSLGCLFEAILNLPQHVNWNKERNWNRPLLKGLKVSIFGYGHIGKIIAGTLAALGANLSVIDPFIEQCPYPLFKSWKDTKVEEAKVIICCMGLNSTSKKLFNKDFFSKANDGLIFINGARGGLVDEVSLKGFLLAHPNSFAFLDVFEKEPFGEEWHDFPQVWKTSHIAGVYKDLDKAILEFEKTVLSDFIHLDENNFMLKYKNELLHNKLIAGELI